MIRVLGAVFCRFCFFLNTIIQQGMTPQRRRLIASLQLTRGDHALDMKVALVLAFKRRASTYLSIYLRMQTLRMLNRFAAIVKRKTIIIACSRVIRDIVRKSFVTRVLFGERIHLVGCSATTSAMLLLLFSCHLHAARYRFCR